MKKWFFILFLPILSFSKKDEPQSWIRINLLGYTPNSVKVAVWCSKEQQVPDSYRDINWQLIDAKTKQIASSGKAGKDFGAYGPFKQTYRLNFSSFKKPGRYYMQAGGAKSPEFDIGDDVYKGAADFCLRYMRQQRSGFNPFLKDSCHTHDGYVLYGEKAGIDDSTYIDVVGGWHDASDYLQYASTSANATWHLLAAYRDFPGVFTDEKQANGLDGKNDVPDVLDEAKWGLDWLLKMNPKSNWMFNQVGDDRDHMGMRIPKQDTNFYGNGLERPVYFNSGEPQQRGKFMNATTGASSTAGKFASVFALAESLLISDSLFKKIDTRRSYYDKAMDAYSYGLKKPGATQTASVRSPYIYAEDNWTDDMELAAISIHEMLIAEKDADGANGHFLMQSMNYAKQEKITPWLGADTAKHYQWYPFINIGHYELARQMKKKKFGPVVGYIKDQIDEFWKQTDSVTGYYRSGIELVWNKANQNAFYRGIPFIWCSNNLTVSFAIQCYWYKQLTGDKTFDELEQANFDWLFGCNPWGTSFVYGLPADGDTPSDPHSAFTHLKNYPIDGGLVDGPVYGSIYNALLGIKLYRPDMYADFQSGLAVYHDDYGDYSTNEPTMDGTASLIYLLAAKEAQDTRVEKGKIYDHGAIIRADSSKKNIALVFSAHEFAEGGDYIRKTLQEQGVKASFFFTGDFYRNKNFTNLIQNLKKNGNYLGPHSDKHLLYCDWNKRDSLLVTKKEFTEDLKSNLMVIPGTKVNYFLPPYEWYNDSIASWAKEMGLQLINYSPGTLSHADYTTEKDKNFRSSEVIYNSIIDYERSKPGGLNGFILLMHVGAGRDRADKFYLKLQALIKYLKQKGYHFQRVDELLKFN